MAMSRRSFVAALDFVTSMGHGSGPGSREAVGVATQGPTRVITDLCVLEPDRQTRELTVVSLHPGVTEAVVREACGWPLKIASDISETEPPTEEELRVLRDLYARTSRAHAGAAQKELRTPGR